jgi:hypothetical protein
LLLLALARPLNLLIFGSSCALDLDVRDTMTFSLCGVNYFFKNANFALHASISRANVGGMNGHTFSTPFRSA